MAAVLFHSRRFLIYSIIEWLCQRTWFRGGYIQLASTSKVQAALPCKGGRHWKLRGAVAQLGERLICIQEVLGSIPISSTSKRTKRACSSGG